ncbi:MAG: aminotransferase class IV [Selenomonas sp.]
MKELSFFSDHFYAPGEAQVDIEDRGYQFGDGIYEVTHVYNGRLFAFDRHLARFRRSMREMHIPITYMDEELTAIHNDLIKKSGIKSGAIYFQVTRGTAARAFPFPGRATPNLSMTIRESVPNREQQEKGISLALAEDIRWLRCDIKSLNLLGAVFAKEKAKAEGCAEALLYRKDTGLVTEGDSASGSITKSRDVNTQAVFSLRGKPLNSFGLTKKVVYENEEFNLLQAALDIEDGLDTLRYNKVIVATDADVDGMHIRLLIITFFLQFFPELIKKGHVYVLQTPLFRVRNKRTKVKNRKVIEEADAKRDGKEKKSDFITHYCYSDEERQQAIKDLGPDPEITRFKGLGEISPDEFAHFIGPDMRLEQVTLHKNDQVQKLLEYYMGKNTMERQNFIIDNLVIEEDIPEDSAEVF